MIWQFVGRREWSLTVTNFTPQTVCHLKTVNSIDNVEVSHVSLSDLFKDYVKGHKTKGLVMKS